MRIGANWNVTVGAIGALIGLAWSSVALARTPPVFGRGNKVTCRLCAPVAELQRRVGIRLPRRAILLDFGNGVFWRNSRLVVIDLDRATLRTYRFPPSEQRPTRLTLVASTKLSIHQLNRLISAANTIWHAPAVRGPPSLRVTDIFETLYVIDGSVMASWSSLSGDDPAWLSALRKAVHDAEGR